MWAVLDYDNKTVIGLYAPDVSEEIRNKDAKGRTQILMTLENSPAYINGTYKNGKFYLDTQEGEINA
jgi:hypothetical protein